MKKPSETDVSREQLRQSIIGLGERSIRKSYYPELQQRIAELEMRNRELLREIKEKMDAQEAARRLNRQLQQSQKMEAIGTLAGGIAHDFNNILTVIVGSAELAKIHVNRACWNRQCPVTENLDHVIHASERARELVRQILAFSRQQNDDMGPLHLAALVREVLPLLRASLPQSIEMKTLISCGDAQVHANATQLHQIIMNLGTNALHAMQESGGTLSVEVKRTEIQKHDERARSILLTPGKYLLMLICDDGCGMEQSVLDRIFDPYFTTKPLGKGTGMGLAVVHGIVKAHNGFISVSSEPGKGTTFSIYLPELEEQAAFVAETYEDDEIVTGNERILLIDDEPLVAQMQARLLESLGYTVTYENHPVKALDLFTSNPGAYDVIFTDMTMPKMNGIALTQHILAIRPDIPVILCTGFSELVNETQALKLGVKAFAMKPLVRKSIAKTVRDALGG